MVTNTQFFNGYSSSSVSQSSLNSASGNSKTSNSTTVSNINNYCSSTMTNNSKGKSNVDSKKNFSEVLNSKKESRVNDKDSRNNDKKSVTDSDKNSKIDELKSKIKELKEEVKKEVIDGNCDEKKVSDILAELLIALNNLLEKNEVSQVLNADENNDMIGKLIEQLTSDNNEGNNLLQQLIEILSSDEAKNSLGSDVLKDMKELLQQLSASLTDDSNENINKGITDIISKLDEMLQNSDEQGKNTITTEELWKVMTTILA